MGDGGEVDKNTVPNGPSSNIINERLDKAGIGSIGECRHRRVDPY